MSEHELKVDMPRATLEHWDPVCECIRQALHDAHLPDARIRFVRMDGDEQTPGDPGRGFMIAPEAASALFTRSWIDTFLWPLIEKRVDRPSRALVDWLLGLER